MTLWARDHAQKYFKPEKARDLKLLLVSRARFNLDPSESDWIRGMLFR